MVCYIDFEKKKKYVVFFFIDSNAFFMPLKTMGIVWQMSEYSHCQLIDIFSF